MSTDRSCAYGHQGCPGHDLDLPTGERRTGKTLLEHLEVEPRTIHPALGPLAEPGELLRTGVMPTARIAAAVPRPKRRTRVEVDAAALAREYSEGASLAALVSRHGHAEGTIRAAILDQGVEMRPAVRPSRPVNARTAAARYRAGTSARTLAAEAGVSQVRMADVLRSQGITLTRGRPRPSG